MDNQKYLESLKTYFQLMVTNGTVKVFQTAMEIGIFKYLSQNTGDGKKIAGDLGLQEKPLEHFMSCLQAIGLADKTKGEYHATSAMAFLTGNYSDLSDSYWEHLTAYLKTGTPLVAMDDVNHSEQQYVQQVKALEWMMKPSAMFWAKAVPLVENAQIIDIGCGSGVWSHTMLAQNTSAKSTCLDWQGVLNICETSANTLGIADRVTFQAGNYHETEFEADKYDLAILANVAHLESREGMMAVLTKVKSALKPNGKLAIIDVFDEQKEGALPKALYQMGLSLRTNKGYAYTKEELHSIAADCGMSPESFIPLQTPPYTMAGMILSA